MDSKRDDINILEFLTDKSRFAGTLQTLMNALNCFPIFLMAGELKPTAGIKQIETDALITQE